MSKTNKIEKSTKKSKMPLILIPAIAVVLGLVAFFVISTKVKNNRERTVEIAFYNLAPDITESISTQIKSSANDKVNFTILKKEDFNSRNIAKKYDLIFTWQGQASKALESDAKEINGKILSSLPSSLKSNKKCLPVLLTHYEIAYKKSFLAKRGDYLPASISELTEFLKQIKTEVFSPFFCDGGNNRTLLNLMGAIAEAMGGQKAYENFVLALGRCNNIDELRTSVLAPNLTVQSIFDVFIQWQNEGLVHPMWFKAEEKDVLVFMETKQVGVLFQSLEQHREKSYNIISEFQGDRFPVENDTIYHGVLAPAVVCMDFSGASKVKNIEKVLVSESFQEALSMGTKLAPVSLRGGAYDVQADDVRFFAASCPAGALPDVEAAAFQMHQEKSEQICSQIRDYLRKTEIF